MSQPTPIPPPSRQQVDALQVLRGLFRHAVSGPVSRDDLRQFGVPERFMSDVLAECEIVLRMHRRGDQAAARERALAAADAAAATFGAFMLPTDFGSPRDLAEKIRGPSPY